MVASRTMIEKGNLVRPATVQENEKRPAVARGAIGDAKAVLACGRQQTAYGFG